jgi:hypothetical protein
MAGATNTIIQILRSSTTALPTTLNPAEQAYSYVSNKLFVGNTDNSVVTIGGKYYVDLIDGATATNTGNTIVRRDTAGNAAFKMVSVTDDASELTDVVNKNYLNTRIDALSSNTIYDGTLGQVGYSNVHVDSAVGGGQVIIIANNSTVATFTKNNASFVQDVMISGNLTVKGNTSYTNVTTLYINNTKVLGESFGLPTSFGGTGLTTVTQNAVLFGNGSGTLGVTNAPTEGQILQYRTDGVKFGGLDGGTF